MTVAMTGLKTLTIDSPERSLPLKIENSSAGGM